MVTGVRLCFMEPQGPLRVSELRGYGVLALFNLIDATRLKQARYGTHVPSHILLDKGCGL
jgi:hypothetical protein